MFTDPDPVGGAKAAAEMLARILHGRYGGDKTWAALSWQEQAHWKQEAVDIRAAVVDIHQLLRKAN